MAPTRALAAADTGAVELMLALAGLALLLGGLLTLAAIAAALLWRRERRLAIRHGALQSEHRALRELLDVWLWRSNAEHALVSLSPPPDAQELSRVPPGVNGSAVWDQFIAVDAESLRAQFEQQQPGLTASIECRNGERPPWRGQLRANRVLDSEGAFAGYVGTVRAAAAPVPLAIVAPPAANDAKSRAPASDDAEHSAFSFTVSHDLRAPIRVVDGFARILKEDYGSLLDRIGNDHLDRVLSAAARMNGMIDALLALSKLSSQPLARQPVDLSQLAGFVAEDLRRQQPGRPVQLTIQGGLRAVGDPTLVRMVVENLLGNAWKYTGRCENPVIRFTAHASEAGVFTVSDNGAGFDMRHADRLFGMFQRLHGASEFEGTGIGLASVRRIVRRHGGDIWAEGEPGRGARFHFSLAPR